MKKRTLTFLILGILLVPTSGITEILTYEDAMRDAIGNSARLRVKVEDVRISDATYRQNFSGLFPELTANSRMERYENLDKRGTGFDTISGQIVGGDTSNWRSNIYLQGQYYLSHWYKKIHETRYYERLRDTRLHECDIEAKKIVKEVTDLYTTLAEGKIRLRYADDILRRLQEIVVFKKEAHAKGQIAREELLKAEAEVSAAEKEAATARRDYLENLERLRGYTGKAYSENIKPLALTSKKKIERADAKILAQATPEYRARIKELEAVRYKERAASNNFFPDVSLYGRYDLYGSNPSSLDNAWSDTRQTSYAAGLMISLPLFDGGVRKWERRRNVYEIKRQEESAQAVAEEKKRDIRALYAGHSEVERSLKHYRKLAEQYARMLDITKKAHQFGERSMTDIREMEKDALTVERDLAVSQHLMASYEKKLAIETDFGNFMSEHYGNGACQY